jgi:hypothetical protein
MPVVERDDTSAIGRGMIALISKRYISLPCGVSQIHREYIHGHDNSPWRHYIAIPGLPAIFDLLLPKFGDYAIAPGPIWVGGLRTAPRVVCILVAIIGAHCDRSIPLRR